MKLNRRSFIQAVGAALLPIVPRLQKALSILPGNLGEKLYLALYTQGPNGTVKEASYKRYSRVAVKPSDECWTVEGEFPVTIPSGTRIAARHQSDESDATDRKIDLLLIGVNLD